jgi:hypothetical protein
MTNDQAPSGASPPGGKSRRRPPTIDLTAKEIEATQSSSTPEQAAATKDTPPTESASAPVGPAAQQPLEPGAGPDATPSPETTAADTQTEAPETKADASPESAAEGTSATAWPPARRAWPLIGAGAAGGAVAAVLAAVLALFNGRDDGTGAFDTRLAQVEQQLREIAARPLPAAGDTRALEDLRSRLARLETTIANPRPAALDPALANRISAIEGEVKALVEQVGIVARRSDEAVATAREARARAEATAAALGELAQKLEHPGPSVVQRSELEGLASRVAATEQAQKALEGELARRAAEGSDRAGRLAVATSALNAAVERGVSFASELATVKAFAADPKGLAPLEPFATAGVPAATTLARDLAALMPVLQQAAGAPSRDGGFLEKLQANAEKLVRIRPLGEVAGGDPAATVARIEFKAMRADLPGALAELATLPPAVRAPAEDWIKQAQARGAAIDTSRRLLADALAGLSK